MATTNICEHGRRAICEDCAAELDTLRNEAADAGDTEQVALCERAYAGDADALAECRRVMAEAEANRED